MAKRAVKDKYSNSYSEWTEKEKELIMTSKLPDREIANKIGRSVSSIHNQRFLIRNAKRDDNNVE